MYDYQPDQMTQETGYNPSIDTRKRSKVIAGPLKPGRMSPEIEKYT